MARDLSAHVVEAGELEREIVADLHDPVRRLEPPGVGRPSALHRCPEHRDVPVVVLEDGRAGAVVAGAAIRVDDERIVDGPRDGARAVDVAEGRTGGRRRIGRTLTTDQVGGRRRQRQAGDGAHHPGEDGPTAHRFPPVPTAWAPRHDPTFQDLPASYRTYVCQPPASLGRLLIPTG